MLLTIKNHIKEGVTQDSLKKMVELRSVVPDIVYDLRYATTNNFMRRRMYTGNIRHAFLRKPARRSPFQSAT
jgi:D-alanyl-D-alanine dipeptidase